MGTRHHPTDSYDGCCAPGTPGLPGFPGVPGTDGATGATGANGSPGVPGTDGATGATGANGSPGVPGTNGATGANGSPGVPGTNGATGATGPAGSSGLGSAQNFTSTTGYAQVGSLTLSPPSGNNVILVNPVTGIGYMINSSTNLLIYFESATGVFIGSVTLPGTTARQAEMTINTTLDVLYIANTGTSNITFISGSYPGTPSTLAGAGSTPVSIDVNSKTNMLYLANQGSSNIGVFTGTVSSLVVTTSVSLPTSPNSVAVNSATNLIYVSGNDGNVYVIDGRNNTLISSPIPVLPGTGLGQIIVNSQTNQIYVLANSNTYVIDGFTGTVVTPSGLATSSGLSLEIDEKANLIYVGSVTLNFWVIDGNTNTFTTTSLGPSNISPNAPFAVNSKDGFISIITAGSGEIGDTLTIYSAVQNPILSSTSSLALLNTAITFNGQHSNIVNIPFTATTIQNVVSLPGALIIPIVSWSYASATLTLVLDLTYSVSNLATTHYAPNKNPIRYNLSFLVSYS